MGSANLHFTDTDWVEQLYLHITEEAHRYTTNLRKVGGSVMLTVPPALLEVLKLKAGASVGIEIEDGRFVVAPQSRPRYVLEDFLTESDYSHSRSDKDQQWVDSPAVGRELL